MTIGTGQRIAGVILAADLARQRCGYHSTFTASTTTEADTLPRLARYTVDQFYCGNLIYAAAGACSAGMAITTVAVAGLAGEAAFHHWGWFIVVMWVCCWIGLAWGVHERSLP